MLQVSTSQQYLTDEQLNLVIPANSIKTFWLRETSFININTKANTGLPACTST